MATYEQNLRTLSKIQQRRDMQTPPDRWEEEQLRRESMICPNCGELLNYISDNDISCHHCGWMGNITKWERDIEDAL